MIDGTSMINAAADAGFLKPLTPYLLFEGQMRFNVTKFNIIKYVT